ncbi:MAG: M3 family oligoendopeptidase [Niameybacter sp.]
MKFSELKYERPDFEVFKSKLEVMTEAVANATSSEEQVAKIKEAHHYINEIYTCNDLVEVRHSINTKDAFYEQESEYWDEYMPLYLEQMKALEKVLLNSSYRNALEETFSKQYFDILENGEKTFSNLILEEMQELNKLTTEYDKLIASAEIEFEGGTYNLSSMRPFMIAKDRQTRKCASEAYYKFFEEHEAQFDAIFDKMVKVRDRQAKKLGFKNYIEYGYHMMNRTDYNEEMVKVFRKQVLEEIVPVANKLYDKQAKRLGLSKLSYYDIDFVFETGNATPKGDAHFILENGKKMYSELSPETKEFFDFMTENELMDLETKPGKQAGGYCTLISSYKTPFIFANFNGTSGDVDVLTHEAGHAFQVYNSRWIDVPGLYFPTYESCEIHSMSMEFITWPWMENFFGEDVDKYKYEHLSSAIKFIPYGIVVDEFQHIVYGNPEMTPAERKAAWRKLENQYLPHKDYNECDILERGAWWFKQGHIFASPFYYIDYTLAQICALQFWKKMNEDREKGWEDYLKTCKVGGTKSFLEIVEIGGLISPFADGCVKNIIGDIESYLMAIDDSKL